MIRKSFIFALYAVPALFCNPIYAGTIKGKVIDKYTRDNLKHCIVYDSTANSKSITDTFGNFALTGLEKGRHIIVVSSGTQSTARYSVNLLNDDVSIQVFQLLPVVKPGYSLLMGKVFDKTTKDPLPGSVICIDSLRIGVNASMDGSYMLNDIPAGVHTITFKMMGYEFQRHKVYMYDGKVKKRNVFLKQSNIQLQ